MDTVKSSKTSTTNLKTNTNNNELNETNNKSPYTSNSSSNSKASIDTPIEQRNASKVKQNSNNLNAKAQYSNTTDFKAADHNGVTVAMKIAANGNVEKFKQLLEENRNTSPEKSIDFEQTNRLKNNLIDIIFSYEQNEILDVLIDYFNSCEETKSYLENVEFFLKIVTSNLESRDKKSAIMKLPIINTELTEEQKNTLEPQYAELINCMIEITDDIETIKKLYFIIKQLKPDTEYLKQQEVTNTKTLIAMQAGLAGNIEVLKFLISSNEIQALNEIQDANKRDILMRLILSDNPDKMTIFNNLTEYSQTFNPRERRHFIITQKDKDGQTVIMHAAKKDERDIVKALVKKHGSSILYTQNNQDKNSLDLANEAGHKDLYNQILQMQAEEITSREKSQEDREAEIARVREELRLDTPIAGARFSMNSDEQFEEDTRRAIEKSLQKS